MILQQGSRAGLVSLGQCGENLQMLLKRAPDGLWISRNHVLKDANEGPLLFQHLAQPAIIALCKP
jgi:hypothetical protein